MGMFLYVQVLHLIAGRGRKTDVRNVPRTSQSWEQLFQTAKYVQIWNGHSYIRTNSCQLRGRLDYCVTSRTITRQNATKCVSQKDLRRRTQPTDSQVFWARQVRQGGTGAWTARSCSFPVIVSVFHVNAPLDSRCFFNPLTDIALIYNFQNARPAVMEIRRTIKTSEERT
jgi:hypothetical protein